MKPQFVRRSYLFSVLVSLLAAAAIAAEPIPGIGPVGEVKQVHKEMMAYPVQEPGKIGAGRVFCTLEQPPGADNTGGDGLAIDTEGNLYITSRLGIQVFNPQGKLLGSCKFPEQPANATFGGKDGTTLYVTARTS